MSFHHIFSITLIILMLIITTLIIIMSDLLAVGTFIIIPLLLSQPDHHRPWQGGNHHNHRVYHLPRWRYQRLDRKNLFSLRYVLSRCCKKRYKPDLNLTEKFAEVLIQLSLDSIFDFPMDAAL